jgi:hypothetical protein
VIIIFPYQIQEVRDLAWACFSPPLLHLAQVPGNTAGIAACTLQLTPERRLWLERLDHDASALLTHLSLRPTHRLGVYFEQLWHFFLQEDPDIELMAHNLPVVDEGKTLGEFDCLYYSHERDCHVHLELAVKYFLGRQRLANRHDPKGYANEWLGPDNRDRLDTKTDQLLQRQIQLSEQTPAKAALHDLGIDKLTKEIALKGYLFQPKFAAPPPPPGYNHDCRLNVWVTCSQLRSHCDSLTTQSYLLVTKMKWLCSAHLHQPKEALNMEQLQNQVMRHFDDDTYPLLIATLDRYGAETARFFVTPEHWPNSMSVQKSPLARS